MKKHGSKKMIQSLLQDIIKDVVKGIINDLLQIREENMTNAELERRKAETPPPQCSPASQTSPPNSSASCTSPQCSPTSQLPLQCSPPSQRPPESLFVKYRNERVARIQAEFKELFPNFDDEVRSLKFVRQKRTGRRKMTWPEAVRRSSRIASGGDEGDCGEVGEVQEKVAENEDLTLHSIGQDSRESCNLPPINLEEQALDLSEDGQIAAMGSAGDNLYLGKHGCVPCKMRFRDSGNLKRHVQLIHEKRDILVDCPRTWCNAKFSIFADMWRHKESCLMVCPYAGCSKAFRKEKRFESHQRSHQAMARRMSDE